MCKRKVIFVSQDEYNRLYAEEFRASAWQAIERTVPDPKAAIDLGFCQVDPDLNTARPSERIRAMIRASQAAYRNIIDTNDQDERWENIRRMHPKHKAGRVVYHVVELEEVGNG